ncbi:uncharacterized protein BXZ73DRAFT_106769 [Epithele typhae]|uniref:uncharacterized protein n=1 Tax=Epithele typhae TaxID=378194 RepID=UPI0020076830|nr:uncharacterized protein BXZ73DRAFT_106769 [Epithele typhae]KAH9913987.1 hypothetical protein BXZ73DRAFT_106769 [Epithele typhae]
MSVAGSDYGGSSYGRSEPRPEKPLIVKCTHEERGSKKITYPTARLCTYDNLRKQVERCFGLNATPFFIAYVDDDSETISITNETDLTEAINYFKPTPSEDPPLSSAASILSGRSFRSSKITLRVNIVVDYDGISLSDTGSLVSLEEYKNRNGSGLSLSLASSAKKELDDDMITVSSKDFGSKYDVFRNNGAKGSKTILAGRSREPLIDPAEAWETATISSHPRTTSSKHPPERQSMMSDDSLARQSDDPISVFARLKMEEERSGLTPGNLAGASTFQTERGANWLRDQSAHISVLSGDMQSVSDFSLEDNMSLELEQNQHGNYRYTLTGSSGSAASQSMRDFGFDEGASSAGFNGAESVADSLEKMVDSRPVSMQATQFTYLNRSSTQSSRQSRQSQQNPFGEDPGFIHPSIPPEVLSFVRPTPPLAPPEDPTKCSNCNVTLDIIKYVCSTCGEIKSPMDTYWNGDDEKGKERAMEVGGTGNGQHPHPSWRVSAAASVSSVTLYGSQHSGYSGKSSGSHSSGSSDHHPDISEHALLRPPLTKPRKPLPLPPSPSHSAPPSRPTTLNSINTLAEFGVQHSLEFSAAPGASPGPGTSPEDAERALSRWRRTAPSQKGLLRHAYIEKTWTHDGWEDIEHGGQGNCHCSTCNTVIKSHRYKCASCDNFNLCRACYRQVYEVHPAHAFLAVPNKQSSSNSSSTVVAEFSHRQSTSLEEPSMTHIGVHCAHCMQEIVGARFHCAICENVDICSNCDAAGLPGNIDSADGGHVSSHIMIKIPHPMSTAELQNTSQMAIRLWTGRDRDAACAQDGDNSTAYGRPRRNSFEPEGSSYSNTVLGTGQRPDGKDMPEPDHGVTCDGCSQPIVGVRYQCANCPSYPKPVSLCERCEARSYALHDTWHVFFKLPRVVDRALVLQPPLPRLYKKPAGPPNGAINVNDPKDYLRSLTHAFAVCDRCMSHIRGEWFHCAYCPKDLCDSCAEADVNMQIFRRFMNEEDPSRSPPLIPFPVYKP